MKIVAILILLVTSGSTSGADKIDKEVQYLLNYIAETECDFIRNGIPYKADKTISHIKKKYRYFKNKISTAEEFIELSASKSMISNKPYLIECVGQPKQTSKQWLLDELVRYRASNT